MIDYPHIDELLDLLKTCSVRKEYMRIKNNTYHCGYVIPGQNLIVLNQANPITNNLETLSHELMHIYFDYIKDMNLPEEEIERLGLLYIDMFPDYYDGLKKKLED